MATLDETGLEPVNGDHVEIKQIAEEFARYVYLPRLRGPEVLVGALRNGLGLLR